MIEGITPTELQDALQGKKMMEACRKGKHLWLELDSGSPALMLHFGMTGYIVRPGILPWQTALLVKAQHQNNLIDVGALA